MSIILMKDAFVSALDHIYHIAGQANEDDRPAEAVVIGPDKEMLTARREDYLFDDFGVEIGQEFAISWSGINRITNSHGIIVVDLKGGKKVEIEACP